MLFRWTLTGLAIAAGLNLPARAAPPQLHVSGTSLKTDRGRSVRLRGVNLPSLEWTNDGEGRIEKSEAVALDDWHANILRLPVNEDRWLGRADGQSDGGAAYRALVDRIVEAASLRKAYVLLDLHWSDAGEWGGTVGQHKMPDVHSTVFWVDAAKRYANNPAVLYDLYNEPHDVSWEVWRNGGQVEEDDKGKHFSYATPGLQALLETVRSTGAKNVVVAGGLDWAYDLTGLNGFALKDPGGRGVVYSTHIYPWKTQWDEKVSVALARFPVIVGEFGCEPDPKQEDPATWAPKVMAYINSHHLSWTAWCFHASATPSLLKDWNYTPTAYWGEVVKKALAEKG